MQESITADPPTNINESFESHSSAGFDAPPEGESCEAFSAVRLALGLAIALLLGGIGAVAIDSLVPDLAGPQVPTDQPADEPKTMDHAADTQAAAAPASAPTKSEPIVRHADPASPSTAREEELTADGGPRRDTLEFRAARERRRQRELESLRKELAAIPSDVEATPSMNNRPREVRPQTLPTATASRPEATAPGPATLAYWNSMNSVIEQEEKMRAAPTGGITNSNAVDFVDRRIAAGTFAAESLKSIPSAGVDTEALALSGKLAAWYLKGVEICKKGKYLLEKADMKTRKGPQGKEWQKQDKEHQQSVVGLNTQGEQVRTRLAAKYRLEFPALK